MFKFTKLKNRTTEVRKGKILLGYLVSRVEPTGRHCYSLKADRRKNPRTYRGKQKAAEALWRIHNLKIMGERKKWSIEQLIIQSWDSKPNSAEQW